MLEYKYSFTKKKKKEVRPHNVLCRPSRRMLEYFLFVAHMVMIIDLEDQRCHPSPSFKKIKRCDRFGSHWF